MKAFGHSSDPAAKSSPSGWAGLRAGGPLVLAAFLLTFVIFYGRHGLLHTVLPVLGSDRLGLSTVHIGFALTLLSLGNIIAQLSFGWLSDIVGRRRLLLPGMAVLLTSQVSLFLITGELSFILLTAFQAAGALANPLPTSLIGDALAPRSRPSGIAVYRVIADAAVLLAPVVLGVALEYGGFDTALGVGMAPTAVALVAVAWLVARARPVPPPGR